MYFKYILAQVFSTMVTTKLPLLWSNFVSV